MSDIQFSDEAKEIMEKFISVFPVAIRESGCEVEKLYISDLHISPCIGCMTCEEKELDTYCAIKNDMTDLYRKFLECDAFVVGFPICTARECSQAATFFDQYK